MRAAQAWMKALFLPFNLLMKRLKAGTIKVLAACSAAGIVLYLLGVGTDNVCLATEWSLACRPTSQDAP
jgi:hypothetical protein